MNGLTVEGRWRLMVTPDGRAPGAINAGGPDEAALRHGWSCVPVVPCDEEAVQRAVTALLEDSGLPIYGGYRETIERRVRLALRAAGETPS